MSARRHVRLHRQMDGTILDLLQHDAPSGSGRERQQQVRVELTTGMDDVRAAVLVVRLRKASEVGTAHVETGDLETELLAAVESQPGRPQGDVHRDYLAEIGRAHV